MGSLFGRSNQFEIMMAFIKGRKMGLLVMLVVWGISVVVNTVAFYFLELKKRNFIPFNDLVIMALFILVPFINTIIATAITIGGFSAGVQYFFTFLESKLTFNLVWKDGKFQRLKE